MLIKLHQAIGALTDKEPPKEFRIFAFGTTETENGAYVFDKEAAEAVLADRARRGIDTSLDYEHASLKDPPPPEGAPAAGWYDLELREDGLWATNVRWTPRALEYLKNGEYRYTSPAFYIDKKTRRVTKFINIALTNDPAHRDQEPLVAAKAVPFASGPVVTDSWDGAAAEKALAKWASSDGSGDKDSIDWGKYAKGFAYYDEPGEAFGAYHLPHHDVHDGKLVVNRRGVEAAAAAVQGARNASIPDADLSAVKAHLAKHYREWGGRAPWEPTTTNNTGGDAGRGVRMETLFTTLGLKKDATEAEALAALNARDASRKELESELLATTGAKTLSEAKGALAALRQKADAHDNAVAAMEKLKAEALEREVTELVETGVKEAKIAPAQKAFWFENGKKDVAMLKAFLATAPKLIETAAKKPAREQDDDGDELTAEDKYACKQLGMTQEAYLKAKKAKKARAA